MSELEKIQVGLIFYVKNGETFSYVGDKPVEVPRLTKIRVVDYLINGVWGATEEEVKTGKISENPPAPPYYIRAEWTLIDPEERNLQMEVIELPPELAA